MAKSPCALIKTFYAPLQNPDYELFVIGALKQSNF